MDNKNLNIYLKILAIFSFFVIFYTGIYPLFNNSDNQSNKDSIELKKGWEYRWGDSSFSENGRPEWITENEKSPEWKTLDEFPSQPPDRNGSKNLWLRIKLPDSDVATPVIVTKFMILCAELFIDGEKIFSSGEIDDQGNGRFSGLTWQAIKIPQDFQNKMLYFRFFSNYYYIGFNKKVYLSSYSAFLLNVIRDEFDKIVFAFLFFSVGVLFVYLYVRLSASKAVLYFAFTSFCLSIYILYYTYSKDLFFSFPFLNTNLWVLSIFYLPVTIIGTYLHFFGDGWKSIIKLLFRINLLFALVYTTLCAINAVFYYANVPLDLFPALMYMRLLLLIFSMADYLILVIDSAIQSKKGDKYARIYLAGMGIFLIFSISYYVSALIVVMPNMQYLIHWGMLGYTSAILIILVDFSAQEKKNNMERKNELAVTKKIQDIIIRDSIIVLDIDHQIETINSKTEQITGYKAGELINHHFSKIVADSVNATEEINQMSSGEYGSFACRLNYQRKDKKEIPMDVLISKIANVSEDQVRILMCAHEVEEHHRLQHSFNITKRESEVIRGIISGNTNKDIADALGIKERTIKTHITNIYNKLGVSNKIQMLKALGKHDLASSNLDNVGIAEESKEQLLQAAIQAQERFAQAEAIKFITRLLKITDKNDLHTLFGILNLREEVYRFQGRRIAQKKDIDDIIQLAERLNDEIKLSKAILKQGQYQELTGGYQDAIQSAEKSISLARKKEQTELELEGILLCGKSLWRLGEYKESQKTINKGIKMINMLNHLPRKLKVIQAYLFLNLGIVYDFQGNHSKAKEFIEQALVIFQTANHWVGEGDTLNNLGIIAYHRENYKMAEGFYKDTLKIYERVNALSEQPTPLANLSEVYWMQHDYFKSYQHSHKSLELSEKLQFRAGEFNSRYCLSMLADLIENHTLAHDYLADCLNLSKQIGDKGMESMALAKKACIRDLIIQEPENLTLCKQALRQARDISALREEALALSCLGSLYLNRKKYRQAVDAFSKSFKLRLKLDQKKLAIEIKTEICRLYLLTNEEKKAHVLAIEITDFLANENLYGTEKPIRIFHVCCQATQNYNATLARKILNQGLDYLQYTTNMISDEVFKKQYLQVTYINELLKMRDEIN
ncbi:tetratricopeptide repeat protein [bacterium]|nr:tetratricopeptide repeat protein [bacterium]